MNGAESDIEQYVRERAARAKTASRQLGLVPDANRAAGVRAMANKLSAERAEIFRANQLDLEAGRAEGLSGPLLNRLELSESGLSSVISGMHAVAELADPVGTILERRIRPNGLLIEKVRVPIGVIGIVYESRPNVTADTGALCIRSGNAVVLRGGKEALHTNRAIVRAMRAGLAHTSLPSDALQFIDRPERDGVRALVQCEGSIDLVMPRGGESLIKAVVEAARVPVIKHYKGVCHIFVDRSADLEQALLICENAKCQRPAVCNAMETLLVHREIAPRFLPALAAKLGGRVELRGDEEVCRILPQCAAATEADWYEEYLDLILSVRIVGTVEEAIDHVNSYGSHHSDAILTTHAPSGERFLAGVDSAVVYLNASTRFTDGGEFGMGAEIGISTDKLHARGPMGLNELTTYKYRVRGTGQARG